MLIPKFVGKLKLIIEYLGVINSKPAILAPHPDNFINQIKLVLRDNWTLILLHDDLRPRHVLAVVVFKVTTYARWLLN